MQPITGLLDIPDTGWSTTKMWSNLLPILAKHPLINMEILLGHNFGCRRLGRLLRSDGVKCKDRFPWPECRPARFRWKIEDTIFGAYRWKREVNLFHSSTVRIPRFGKWKKCVTVLDTARELFPNEFGSANRSILELRRRAIHGSDRILTISEYSKNCITSIFNISPNKIFICPLGINQKELLGKNVCVHDDKPFLLYVGTRAKYKNFIVLLQALANTPGLKDLDLIAVGGGELAEGDKKFLRGLGLLSRIKIVDDLSENKINDLYRKAVALIYPSKNEGFGLPPLEAQAVGCPVIASRAGALPEVIGNGGLFFDPDDSASLGKMILKVSCHEIRNQIIFNGYENIKRYSWEQSAQKMIEMYLG